MDAVTVKHCGIQLIMLIAHDIAQSVAEFKSFRAGPFESGAQFGNFLIVPAVELHIGAIMLLLCSQQDLHCLRG